MSADEVKMLELDLKKVDLRIKKTEVVAKYVSLLVLLIGIAIPFYQYVNTLKKEQQEREDRRVNEVAQRNKEIEAASREAENHSWSANKHSTLKLLLPRGLGV